MAGCSTCVQKSNVVKGNATSNTNKLVTKQITNKNGKIVTIYIKGQ
jgi:hypothetical protein